MLTEPDRFAMALGLHSVLESGKILESVCNVPNAFGTGCGPVAPYNAAIAIGKNGLHMTEQHPIAVLGGGSFGTAVANLLAENGHRVRQWMRDPEQAEAIRVNRENPRYLKGIKIHPAVCHARRLRVVLCCPAIQCPAQRAR